MGDILLLVGAVFFGVFVQAVSGFGLGLVAMPILSTTVGLDIARPLMALVAVVIQTSMMIKTRKALSFRAIGTMSVLGFLGIPVGTYLTEVGWLREEVLLTGLALLTIGYALYALFSPQLPELKTDRAMGPFAFASGILTGAYNVGGPPIIIYADARRWTADQMRSNVQGFFMFKGVVLIVTHALSGNYTPDVWTGFAWTVPAMAAGLVLGFSLYGKIDDKRFRQIVLWLLVGVGGKMLFDIYIIG
jgi:uncharacterized membrane protein YfcA